MKIKHLLPAVLLLALLLTGCAGKALPTPEPTTAPTAEPAPTPTPTPETTLPPTPTPKPVSAEVQALADQNSAVWSERQTRDWMVGRLLIPSVEIDVALFEWGDEPELEDKSQLVEVVRQAVTDHEDSALIYSDGIGWIIADHSNQDFSRLPEVKEGDAAYILAGDRVVSLKCSLVADGVNTGHGITDADGNMVSESVDYLCYTCLEDWTHVRIVGFTMTDEDHFDRSQTEESGSEGEAVVTMSAPQPTESAQPQATAAPAETPAPTPVPTAAPTQAPEAPAPRPVQPYVGPTDDYYGGVWGVEDSGNDGWDMYAG